MERLIDSSVIKAVTLTGSVSAGKAIAARAGARLKKTVLELGGSDPYVVLEDCDLEKTVETCVKSRLINSGQSCIAAKRFIVEEAVADRFERIFTEQMAGLKVGDPMDRSNDLGPLARADLLEALHDQVQRTLQAPVGIAPTNDMRPGDVRAVPVPAQGRQQQTVFQQPTQAGIIAGLILGSPEFQRR